MLGYAKKEGGVLQSRSGYLDGAKGLSLDTVVDTYRFSPGAGGHVTPEKDAGDFRNTSDCVDIAKALLQDRAVKHVFRKAEIEWDFVRIKIVQRHNGWAMNDDDATGMGYVRWTRSACTRRASTGS